MHVPVEGGRASAELVDDDERGLGGGLQNRRGLNHLGHKSRHPALRRVTRAHPVDCSKRTVSLW